MHKLDFPKFNNTRVRFLSDQEEKTLFAALTDRYRKACLLSINTGLREAELYYLKWQDIDFERGEIIIIAEHSKNRQSRRIPMNQTCRSILAALHQAPVHPSGRVFGQLNPAWLRYVFHKAVKASGLQDLRFHDLRHTFASRLVMSGVDIRTVQELMGHNVIAMTLRYSHLADEHKKAAVERLDRPAI
jgi:integrase